MRFLDKLEMTAAALELTTAALKLTNAEAIGSETAIMNDPG
ncbi:MAG: hypothetical protein ACR2OE_08685 [Thermomicrobiales bacterium]